MNTSGAKDWSGGGAFLPGTKITAMADCWTSNLLPWSDIKAARFSCEAWTFDRTRRIVVICS